MSIIAENIDCARVEAVVDPIPDKGRQLAKSVGAEYYPCYDTMLSEADVDTVAICTPTFLHAEMVVKAAHRGKNIFCEKPIAVSIEQADQMIEAVRSAGVHAMAGHVLRFWPEYVRVKEIADIGKLGKPVHRFFERLAVILTDRLFCAKLLGRPDGSTTLGVRVDGLRDGYRRGNFSNENGDISR